MKQRGRPRKIQQEITPSAIDFSQIVKLKSIEIDERMMEQMESGLVLDLLISHEGGMPCATNTMWIGDPGVGKTTVLLDFLASVQLNNPDRKCLFISGEMGKKQMFKYTQRFPQFGAVETMFMSDYTDHNAKDVIEQLFDIGWDLVLIDSAAEVIEAVRNDNDWERKVAESWLVDLCNKNNKGLNKRNKYTSFMVIQQVTKSGMFVGSNKLKHLMDAAAEMRRDKDSGSCYIVFNKNRNGDVENKLFFQLTGSQIIYSNLQVRVEDDTEN